MSVYRNSDLVTACRMLPCQHCGADDGTVVGAHSNQLRDGKGRGIKAHDCRVAALCASCHSEIDQGSRLTRYERIEMFEEAWRATMIEFFTRGWLAYTGPKWSQG
ncbi:MAG: hypothetical protein WDA07_06185 [Leucobacter sp.]